MTDINLQKHNVPTAIVMFGGTGNLAQTKLLPALLDLFIQNVLPDSFVVIGLSRKEMSDEEYQDFVHKSINEKAHNHAENVITQFCSHMRYVSGSFDDISAYERIKVGLQTFDDSINQCSNKLFYLAVPPSLYSGIFEKLDETDVMALCDNKDSWARLLVEKPFGNNLETAQALEVQLRELFKEEQVYRIDHYLAKDAIENIISLRFTNSILNKSWNREQIESIAIRLFESKNVSTRGAFYDGIGALRDVGQNHMLQILALLTMEHVDVHDALSVRNGRAKALRSLSNQKPEKIVRGQYEGFVDTEGVEDTSQTETYFKIETEIKTKEWKGVKVTLESGKALHEATTEAEIIFHPIDKCSCGAENGEHIHKNILKIIFSPEEKISLTMWVKKPGFDFVLEERDLVLTQEEGVDEHSPEAYERVLHDCIIGNQTRFVSGEEVFAAWEFITPILEAFQELPMSLYTPGSHGPVKKE